MAKGANKGTGGSGGKKKKAEKKSVAKEVPQQRANSGNTPHARYGAIMPHAGKKKGHR